MIQADCSIIWVRIQRRPCLQLFFKGGDILSSKFILRSKSILDFAEVDSNLRLKKWFPHYPYDELLKRTSDIPNDGRQEKK